MQVLLPPGLTARPSDRAAGAQRAAVSQQQAPEKDQEAGRSGLCRGGGGWESSELPLERAV